MHLADTALSIEGPIPTRPIRVKRRTQEAIEKAPVRSPKPRKELSIQELKFVEFYIQLGNGYRAALAAGYSDSLALNAFTILNRAKVRAEINRRTTEKFAQLEINSDKVIEETARMAFANMLDYVQVKEEDGSFVVDLAKVDRDMGVAIQELSYDAQGRPRIKLVDKKPALELLAKFFKMPTPEGGTGNGAEGGPVTITKLDQLILQNITINNPQAGQQLSEGKVIEGK
jgi:phage terminase small subunit